MLFQNPDTKGSLPWRGMPSRIMLLKLINKFSIVMFSFETLTATPIANVAFTLIAGAVLFMRFTTPLRYHWKPYLNLTVFFEITIFWFALWNTIVKITKAQLTLYTFIFFIVVVGIAPVYAFTLNLLTT